jgi:hypothetical protein
VLISLSRSDSATTCSRTPSAYTSQWETFTRTPYDCQQH